MSRETGKLRTAAKKQARAPKKGERQLEWDALILDSKAASLILGSTLQSNLLNQQESKDIKDSVDQLQLEAERLRIIATNPHKTRSIPLDTVDETHTHQTSSEGEEDEAGSRLGSLDTQPYNGIPSSSPFTNSILEKSPVQMQYPLASGLVNNTPPLCNPQFNMNPPPASPNVTAAPRDPMLMMQAMFAQQAQANRQQQDAMMAHQVEISRQQAEANLQLQMMLAKSLDRQLNQHDKQLKYQTTVVERQAVADARLAIKPMKEGINIVQYFEHLEAELEDAQIPLAKWKPILVAKLSTRAEKTCTPLIHNPEATYKDLKKHLFANIGPSADELCNIVHGASYTEFQDKKEAQKLQHSKYIAERYFLGIKQENDKIIEHMAVRLYKFHCHKRFSHTVKLSKVQSFAELLEMTSSFDSQLDYEKTSKHHSVHTKPFQKKAFCDYCTRSGHLEADCFKKQGTNKHETFRQPKTTYKPNTQEHNTSNTSKYYKPTHKDAGVKSRSAIVNWSQTSDTVNSIKGIINGHEADVVIDTGAQITVVPGKFIFSDNLTGETVSILGVNGDPMPYQTANIPITLRNKTVYETVAVAPEDQLNAKVLLSAPMDNTITDNLLDNYFNKQKSNSKQLQVSIATRSSTATTPAAKYFSDTENSEVEDDRASDLS